MSDFERTRTVNAPPAQVYAFVSEVGNLPEYLPTTHSAQPQGKDRVRVQGEARGHGYDADGWFKRDEEAHRLEWGSDGEMNYSGWLQVEPGPSGASSLTVHLRFDPPAEMRQGMGDADARIREGLDAALESIARHCEGRGGKVEPQGAQAGR